MTSIWKRRRYRFDPIFTAVGFVCLLAVPGACSLNDDNSDEPIDHLTGTTDLIMRIEERDAFDPFASAIDLPLLSLYGDGTLIVHDPDEDGAGSGLPILIVYQLNEAGIQYLLDAARDAGLFNGDRRYAGPYEDVPVTRITVNAGGSTAITSVDGLDITDPEDIPGDERDERQELSELVTLVHNRDNWLTGDRLITGERPFDIERLQVTISSDDDPVQPSDPLWPLASSLAELHATGSPASGFGETRCVELGGDDAQQLISALTAMPASGGAGTTFQSEGDRFLVFLRPLLPEETACP